MGTDIHGVIQAKLPIGAWTDLAIPFPTSRNYDAFAILADVRNGTGFAGVRTGDGFNPIALPRGLPEGVVNSDNRADFGDHSFSWLTLREIFEYDYDQTTTHCGLLTLYEFARFDKRRTWTTYADESSPRPESYCGDVSGGKDQVEKIGENEARNRIAFLKEHHPEAFSGGWPNHKFFEAAAQRDEPIGGPVWVGCSWTERYIDSMRYFLCALQPAIKYGLDDTRIVFGFDS